MKQEMLFEMAFSREFQELSEKNDAKNLLDVKVLSQKREELTALMNAQNHENPIGSMLEVFCRDEIKRCTESLSKGMNNTQKLAAELRALKNEIEAMTDSNDPKVTKSKQYQELRSMINIAETRLKEALKELDAINLEVEDAEALLLKASSLKILEEALLPLFSAINPDFARLEGCSTTTVCVSLVLLAQGSFDTKCNELYNIVDDKNSGLFDLQFVMKLGGLLFESLQCLSIIPKSLRKVEMENSIIRGFLNFSVNFRSDHISEYELKLLIAIIISQNSKLMECLGYVHPLKQSSNAKYKNTMISNYQLSNMSSLAAVFQGFIAPSNAIRAIHFELQRFKPNLLEIKRRNLHDRAFAMGSVDPLRTDYSKFFAKKEKKSSYYVKPLDNGMYTNSEYYSEAARIRSIIKIQSFVRTILNKKLAEKESRRLAYMEAKVAVVKQLKNRILKEFQQREASKGMGKMKWDAEIRMKQAKLRADGQVVSRTETVMIMVEEAIASAKQQIDERFRQFEPKTSTNLNNNSTLSESPTSNSIVAFGLPTRFAPQIRRESVLPEDSTDEDNLLMKDIDSKESTEDNVASNFLEYIENPTYLLKLFPTLVDKNMHYNSNYTGDVVFLTIFRLVLMQPEVETYQHLFNRLNLMHKVFTVFKVREILGEFPSKRLLVKYIRSKSDELLREDLKSHFKFKKFADIVAKELRELSNADLEYGVLTKVLNNTCQKVFAFFINIFEKEFSKIADEKLKANQALKNDQFSVSKVIASELNILQNRSMQLTSSLDSVVVRLHQDQLDLNQIRFSIDRVDNEIASFQMKMLSLNDNEFHQVSRIIPLTWRYDWNRRFYDAKNLASTMSKDALLEMENVVNEFLFTVGNCSVTIIHELFLPEHMKTVKIVSRKGVDGRGIHSGRGLSNGERYYFESHNIYFTILLDYDGIFNGSDEYAAKSGNQELLASQIVLNAEVPLLFPPLTATIDYFGYRVLATAKLPIVHASFGDDGLLQSTHTDQVHGMLNKGETYLNKNRKASGLVKMLATKLNIKEHKCKGTLDPSPSSTFSAMLKVYRGVDESFYVRNCKSLMPSELHMATPHLTTVPRLQSIFWRFIRPELIELNSVTLSPDCGTVITMGLDDDSGNREDLVHTTNSMLSKIPIFIKRLLSKNLQLPTSINQELILSQDFHKEGINLRHMGLVRSMLWRLLPGKCSIYHNESFLRTTEDLREELKNGEKIYINGELFTIKEINKIKISHNRVPLNRVYSGDSVHRVETYCGGIDEDKGNNTLSLILLAEMVARSMKNLIRFQLREFSSINRSCSLTISQQLLVDSFNLITGASLNSANYFAEVIYSAVRERFGNCSIRPSERKHFSFILRPAITYLVGRLQSMMGVQLHPYCVNEFEQNPFGFTFSPGDIQQLKPIVKHNFSDWYYIQAVNLAQLADEVREKDYHFSVMRDQPLVFFTFSERRGSKSASNHGTLGHLYDAVVSDGCILEQSGPIKSNPFIRSVGFRPISTPMIDIKHHISLVPQSTTMHFSIEMFVRNSSNCDFNKTLITSGRFQISISRDGYLVVSLYQECHTIALTLVKVDENKWFHVIMAYDGTSLRVYLNYSLISEVETKPLFDLRLHAFEQEHLAKIQGLKRDEESEKEALKGKVNSEANVFFQTKEGVSTLKRMSQVILDTEDPDIEMPDNGNGDRLNKARELKANALKKAKERYTSDLYESKIREVGSRYKQILLDLEEQKSAYLREGKLKSFNPIRIGASLPDANNRTGSSYFHGEISCVSIYGKCLSQDEVRMHFLSSLRDSRKDANRLHSLVADKFMHAMRQGGVKQRHTKFLNIYARSLCNLLYFEPKERDIVDTSHILSHLLVLLEKFKNQKELEPVMQIIKHLPRDQEFSIVIVKAISVVRAVDKTFFSRTASISRKDIVNIPFEYSLVSPERSSDYFETASFIFQEVVKDIDLMFIYGDVDLRWISQLSSPKLVIALVKSAMEDKHLRVIKIAEVFSAQYASNDLLCDDDVQVIYNLFYTFF